MFKKASFKLIFDILFFLVVMNGIATLILIPLEGFDLSLSNRLYEPKEEFTPLVYMGVINEIAFTLVFVMLAYHLRKLAQLFMVNAEFKSFNVVKHLKRGGLFLAILGLSLGVKKAFLLYYFEVTRHYFQTNSMLYLLLIVIGLSFIRLSRMLKLSIEAKQEQDLTI